MLLTIDARVWKTGIGTYTLNLLKAIRRLECGFRVSAIIRAESALLFSGICDETRIVDVPIYTLREQFRIPLAARGCSLLHIPHYNVPLLYRGPLVVTIHDLTHLTEPAFSNTVKAWVYARPMLHIAARKASHVITDSEYSRKAIVERLGIPVEKTSVAYLGVNPCYRPTDRCLATANIEAFLKTDRPYILHVGNLKPHKNLGALARAFSLVRSRRRMGHLLVFVGDDREGTRAVLEECARLGMDDAVLHVPWVPDDLLPQVYAAADLAVVASKSEGFGLPVLEAMACGTPVACSRAASLPEIGGDAVAYFDPYSIEEMAAVIEQVLDSPTLQVELREGGPKQAAKFTWDECARKHLDVYRKILNQ